MRNSIKDLRFIAAALALVFSQAAHAYIGPGAGLGAIGTLLAFFGAILLAIVGFVWYPIKRLLKRFKRQRPEPAAEQQQQVAADAKAEEGETYSQ